MRGTSYESRNIRVNDKVTRRAGPVQKYIDRMQCMELLIVTAIAGSADESLSRKVMKNLRLSLTLLAIVITTGVAGYHFIEGMSYFDALYMTIITISTVGFQEIKIGRAHV